MSRNFSLWCFFSWTTGDPYPLDLKFIIIIIIIIIAIIAIIIIVIIVVTNDNIRSRILDTE